MDRLPGHCIFLTGAPEASSLDWSEGRLLSTFTIGPILRLDGTQQPAPTPTPSWQPPKWRDVPMPTARKLRELEASNGHKARDSRKETEKVTKDHSDFSFEIPSLQLASRHPGFLEHSLTLLDDLASSQIAPATGVDDSTTFGDQQITVSSTSDLSDTSYAISDSFLLGGPSHTQLPQAVGPITDLKTIPSAAYLTSVVPQTLTVNLLAAVINVSLPRAVSLRRNTNRTMEILELLLGDETRAGFSVSFWLVPLDESQGPNAKRKASPEETALREALKRLKPGHVVAVGNVALSSFKGAVYGQSLNRRVTRNSTWVTKVDEGTKLEGALGIKINRVQGWAERFVGGGGRRRNELQAEGSGDVGEEGEELPPDTQIT